MGPEFVEFFTGFGESVALRCTKLVVEDCRSEISENFPRRCHPPLGTLRGWAHTPGTRATSMSPRMMLEVWICQRTTKEPRNSALQERRMMLSMHKGAPRRVPRDPWFLRHWLIRIDTQGLSFHDVPQRWVAKVTNDSHEANIISQHRSRMVTPDFAPLGVDIIIGLTSRSSSVVSRW